MHADQPLDGFDEMALTSPSPNPARTRLDNALPMRRSQLLPPLSKHVLTNSKITAESTKLQQFNDQTKTAQMHVYKSFAAKNTQNKTNGN